jgi:autotransporter-associated beta strand protein
MLHFQLPSPVQSRLRPSVAALLSGVALAGAMLMPVTSAQAQSYFWGGAGSTTSTTDYNLGTNWGNPPAGAPPVAAGQNALFEASGSTTVDVTSPVAPHSWLFDTTSQSYTIGGSDVTFSPAGGFPGGIGVFANSGQTISIANNIGESAAGAGVLQQGNSTLILSGTNTYSGGTTISSGALLQVTNNSSVGSGAVTLNGGTFQADGFSDLKFTNNFKLNAGGGTIDANGIALTIAGNITDGTAPGGLSVADTFGGGRVILTGTNTYTGGTTICGCAVLQLGDATHTGSIVGAVANQGTLGIVNANTAGITSIDNDGGGGFSFTTFVGANTASTIAITNRNGGETDFGLAGGTDTATAGNAIIVNRLGGSTVFNAMSTAGNAVITNRFAGQTLFFDDSSAGNATIVNRFRGATIFDNFSTAGNANITNRFGGSTFFGGNSTAGNATITNNSSGGVFGIPVGLGFFQASTAGTATIINNNNGFIAFGFPFGFDTSSADHAVITNNAGSGLEFNALTTAGDATITTLSGAGVQFFDGSTGGNAQFVTNGTGYVDFSFSTGPNGDGRITAGSLAGSGSYYIGAGNTLTVGSNNLSTEVSGVIADFNPSPPCGCPGSPGPGALEKVGTGTMILSGTNSYTGTTTVFGGVLDVEGSIASSSLTTVNANAALTGAGTVGDTTIASGGIFLPGNGTPGSSMTVAGNLAFQSGALYLVQLNSGASTFANVTGTAALAGTVGASFAPGSTVMKQYMILSAAGGRSGAFDGVGVIAGSGALVASLSYDPTHAYLNFALDFGATPGLNVNQRNVGNALTNFFNANGRIPAAFATLGPAGLSQVSGETATGSQQTTFDAMNIFLGLLTDPFVAGRGDGVTAGTGAPQFAEESDSSLAYAAKKKNGGRDAFAKFPTKAEVARNNLFDQRWSIWGAAYGGDSRTDGNAALGSNNSTARAFGFVAGADYRISPATLAGFALAGGGTNFAVNGFGSGRSDLFQAGAFVRHNVGAAYVSGALAYGWQDVTTDRTVTIAGIDRLHAEFNANAYSGRVEGGYRFISPWMGVTPYAAGQFTTYSLPAYAEQVLSGAGTFALNYAAKDVTASRSELGIRTDRSFAMQNAILTLRGRAAWAHNFNTDRNISAVFQTLPGASFVVNGAAQAHDSALTTASAEMKWLNGWSAAATFEGEFSNVTRSYAGKGVVRYAW